MIVGGTHINTLFYNFDPANSFEFFPPKDDGVPRPSDFLARTVPTNLFPRSVSLTAVVLMHLPGEFMSGFSRSRTARSSSLRITKRSSTTLKQTPRRRFLISRMASGSLTQWTGRPLSYLYRRQTTFLRSWCAAALPQTTVSHHSICRPKLRLLTNAVA